MDGTSPSRSLASAGTGATRIFVSSNKPKVQHKIVQTVENDLIENSRTRM